MVTAAPSFLLPLLLALPLSAQAPRAELRVGVLWSSTLVEDLLASPALAARLGPGLGRAPTARVAPAPELALGASLALNARLRASGLVGWQPGTLRAEDAAGERDVQDLSLVHGLLELAMAVRGPLFVSVAAGALAYRGERTGLFAEGADIAPLLRLGAGVGWALAGQAMSVRLVADAHRFDSALIRAAGGAGGGVFRYGLQLGVTPGGGR